MNSYLIDDIPQASYFSQAVYLDPHYVLIAPDMQFTPELGKIIRDWGYSEVYSDGEIRDMPDGAGATWEKALGDRNAVGDLDQLHQAERFYKTFQGQIVALFNQVSTKGNAHFNTVAETIKSACDFVKGNRRYLMRVERLLEPASDEDYLASHTARSTVIALIIGLHLKLPSHRLIELGVAALFHEIGMIKLPPQIYLSSRPLTEQEKKLIYNHPVLGFNILKSMNFPLMVCLAALEHHERENGSGYPQRLTGDHINLYAKIIAVACSYEAISSKRPHKEAKDGYTGMLELLKNDGKQYDDTVVRALVFSLSLYPIGLYVLLSNGKKGQVVDVDPENPRYPIVQIFGELMPDGKNVTMQTTVEGLHIVRPLTREETEG